MRYLKPQRTIKVNGKIYPLVFSLEVIDELQDKTGMAMTEIISLLTSKKNSKKAVECIIQYMTGETVTDNYEYYSVMLLDTYIEQIKYKGMPETKGKPEEATEYEPIDIEYWFYLATVVLRKTTSEAWEMTLKEIRTLYNEHLKYTGVIKEDKVVNIDDVI